MTTIDTVEALDEARGQSIISTIKIMCAERGIAWEDNGLGDELVIARAIRAADEAAGLMIVPKEPTDKMLEAVDFVYGDWDDHGDVYTGMLAASPFAT